MNRSALVHTSYEKFIYFQKQFKLFIDKANKKLSSISSTEVIDNNIIELNTDLYNSEKILPLFDPFVQQGINWIQSPQKEICDNLINLIKSSYAQVTSELQSLLDALMCVSSKQ